MAVTLRAFTCGWLNLPTSFYIGGEESAIVRAPIPAYLIEHPKGRVLFDTGLPLRARDIIASAADPRSLGFEFEQGQDIASHLLAVGIDPGSIDWIVNSHLHSDHCGGNAAIFNATIILQREELAVARAQAGSMLYDAHSFETGQAFRKIDGEFDLFGDGTILVFPTPGHTAGHQSMRVALAGGPVILAGDCCYLKRSLDELRVAPSDTDKDQALLTLRRLHDKRRAGTRIFYGHDGHFWTGVAQSVPLA